MVFSLHHRMHGWFFLSKLSRCYYLVVMLVKIHLEPLPSCSALFFAEIHPLTCCVTFVPCLSVLFFFVFFFLWHTFRFCSWLSKMLLKILCDFFFFSTSCRQFTRKKQTPCLLPRQLWLILFAVTVHTDMSHLCHVSSPFWFTSLLRSKDRLNRSACVSVSKGSWTFAASPPWLAGLSTWRRRSETSPEIKSSGGPSSFHQVEPLWRSRGIDCQEGG